MPAKLMFVEQASLAHAFTRTKYTTIVCVAKSNFKKQNFTRTKYRKGFVYFINRETAQYSFSPNHIIFKFSEKMMGQYY